MLDARDRSNVCAAPLPCAAPAAVSLVEACAHHGTRCAVVAGLTSRNPAPDAANLLLVRTGAVYAPWDRSTRAVRILEALDSGRTIEVDPARFGIAFTARILSTASLTCCWTR